MDVADTRGAVRGLVHGITPLKIKESRLPRFRLMVTRNRQLAAWEKHAK